jgi:hypothetical protein
MEDTTADPRHRYCMMNLDAFQQLRQSQTIKQLPCFHAHHGTSVPHHCDHAHDVFARLSNPRQQHPSML